MLNLDKAKERLCKRFLPDFNIKLKRNDKGVTTISFKDEDTNVVVNLKFNENTLATTIANYYTKEQTNSQINIAKEAINLGVSNTYETKANVETKVSLIETLVKSPLMISSHF